MTRSVDTQTIPLFGEEFDLEAELIRLGSDHG